MLSGAVKRLRTTNQLKEGMERVIIDQRKNLLFINHQGGQSNFIIVSLYATKNPDLMIKFLL